MYETRWEISYDSAFKLLYRDTGACVNLIKSEDHGIVHGSDISTKIQLLQPYALIFDLRSDSDFKAGHLLGAINLPLSSMKREAPSSIDDSSILEAQWKEIAAEFSVKCPLMALAEARTNVIVLCYQGDTSKVASSVLRAKNIEAYSVKGGHLWFLSLRERSRILGSGQKYSVSPDRKGFPKFINYTISVFGRMCKSTISVAHVAGFRHV